MDQTHGKTQKANNHPKPTKSELMSSAKLVADAAKSKLGHEPNNKVKVDKSDLAGAAADLLNAASHYGKLDEKGVGKMFGKAENYLHKYETSHSTTTATTTTTTATASSTAEHKQNSGGKHSEQSGSSSGYGEYIKMAEGIFKKHSGETHAAGSEGGGNGTGGKKGDYLKMAGDFLKKH